MKIKNEIFENALIITIRHGANQPEQDQVYVADILVSPQPSLSRVLLPAMLLFTAVLALLLHAVSAHERSDRIAYFSAELGAGNKCGPQRPITGDAGYNIRSWRTFSF